MPELLRLCGGYYWFFSCTQNCSIMLSRIMNLLWFKEMCLGCVVTINHDASCGVDQEISRGLLKFIPVCLDESRRYDFRYSIWSIPLPLWLCFPSVFPVCHKLSILGLSYPSTVTFLPWSKLLMDWIPKTLSQLKFVFLVEDVGYCEGKLT